MGNEIVLTQIIDEYESLIQEVQKLKMVVAALEAEKDDLELNVCRRLRAEYDEKIGHLELQITSYNLEIERLRSIIESMQAAVNRDEKITPEDAGKEADEKLKNFYDDLGKRAEQAKEDEEFAKRRAEQDEKNAQDAGYSEDDSEDDEPFDWDEFFKNIDDLNKAFEDFFRAFGNAFGGSSGSSGDYSGSESFDQGGSAKKNVNPAKELKSLYRKIVKALHPDNKKNRTPKDDELLMEAKKAFEEGNLERLRQIAEMIEDEDIEKRFKNTPEDIEALKNLKYRLKTRLMYLQREVQRIKNSFPYNEKDFLADDEAVAAKQEELNKIIESCKNTIAALRERIAILQEQMNS
jgi:hypothetical protein